MKTKVTISRLFMGLLVVMPLIDSINGILLRNSISLMNIGQIYRITVLFCLFLMINRVERKQAEILLASFMVFLLVQLCVSTDYGVSNVLVCLKLFIPIFMMYVLKGLLNKEIITFERFSSVIERIALLTPLTIIIPYIGGIGYHTYDSWAGYKGFYFATNEISFAISSCIMYLVLRLSDDIKAKYMVLLVMNISVALLVGTKSSLAVAAASIFLLILSFLRKKGDSKLKKIGTVTIIFVAVIGGIITFKDNLYAVYMRWIYGRQQYPGTSMLFSLTSGRTSRIEGAWKAFHDGPLFQILFGWGLAGANNGKPIIEMDYFDLFFAVGWIGFIIIMILYLLFLKHIKKNFWKVPLLGLTFILIFAGGHVLYAGLGGMMYALIMVYLAQYSQEKQNGRHCL